MIYSIVGMIALMFIWKYEKEVTNDYGDIPPEHQKNIIIMYLGHIVYMLFTIIFK